MTPRMLSATSLLLGFSLCSLPALADSGPVLYEGGIDADSYTWTQTASGQYLLVLDGGRALGVTDQADLPALDIQLLVPSDLAISGVTIEPIAVRREPVPGPVARAAALQAGNGDLLPQQDLDPIAGVFPATWGSFGGLHTWRGYRLLAVTVHPFRLYADGDEGAGELEVLEQFSIRAVVDGVQSPQPIVVRERRVAGERAALDKAVRQLVDNPQAVSAYAREDGFVLDYEGGPFLPTPNPSLEGSGVRYLIVTNEEFAGEFQRLADHRTAMGLPAKVVTREWVEANHRRGIDFQETLRMFLQEAYAKWGVEFLLLGGDVEILPTRVIRSTFYPFGHHTDIPTDLYFAGLDGNWGADGDGWLGEPYVSEENPGDDADFAPDIHLARAPVRSLVGAEQFVDKILVYEMASSTDLYANRILYAAEVLFPSPWHQGDPITLDGAHYANRLIEEVIEPCTDMEYTRMYETDAIYPRDAPLTRAALIDTLNTGHYGQVNQFGHGHFFVMSVADANFTVGDAAGLTNGPNYFMLCALNCASGAFDVSCLMEQFVENPDGGSIISIGAAREAFPSNTFGYQRSFYTAMSCQDESRVVVAFNTARMEHIGNSLRNTVDRWTQLNAAIVGDPAISIWNGTPSVPVVSVPSSLTVGEQQVVIQVLDSGGAVGGADVCIRKGDETYASGVTDGSGTVSLRVIPASAGEAILTVSGRNLEYTSRTIPVTGSATYLTVVDMTVEDDSANGNGRPEAGETVKLWFDFEDVGGSGASGREAVLTTTDTELIILDDTVLIGDVAPGGITSTTSPFLVKMPATMRDGSRPLLRVTLAADGGEEWVSEVVLEVLAPEVDFERLVIDDSTYGNGNGIPENGERLVLYPYLKNFGAGRLDQMAVQVLDAADGVTIHETFGIFEAVEFLVEATYSSGGLSLTLSDVTVPVPCRLLFTDNYGRTMSQLVEFNQPSAPPAPDTDGTIAPDAIALRWEPDDPARLLGYNIYRSDTVDGQYERINPDLVRGIAYFEDRGLAQLTVYWYKVTAVDTFLCESEFSPIVTQGTMPPELENFPLGFGVGTSSHLAVGDVDGDQDLEIILASDEVYAWNHDASELIDGDNNSQTTGPLTGVDGQFEPAGVVLAELDGEPGLEIIVSERLNAHEIHVYHSDGTLMEGWPRSLQSSYNWATPSVGDVDGDGDNEIVVNDTAGRTFVWHHDGTELRDGDDDPATDGVFLDRVEGWGYSSPALFDLDGDGGVEIIFGTKYWNSDNALLAYRADGSQVPGFPFATGDAIINCSPAVADLNGDGDHEIIFFTKSNEQYVLEHDGQLYTGFPITNPTITDDSTGPSPAVGNFDGDDDFEIVWPINGGSFRMDLLLVDTGIGDNTAGDIMAGWPLELPCNSEGSPVVGDINGDGRADILQPVGNSETETPDLLYAFNADGTAVAGFPIRMDGHCRSTPVICDIDGDRDVDIVYGSWDRLVHIWDMPFDFNPGLVPWSTFQGNARRTGVAYRVSVTPVEDDQLPRAFTVMPPHPNPFNPVTKIRLYVAPGPDTRLEVAVFDLRGRRVRRLFAGEAGPGWRDLTWDGRDDSGRGQASGIYFVRARQARETATFKMTLVK